MSCDFLKMATVGVQGLQPYVPGKPVDELERELGISNIVKLASNENPLGPSDAALNAIQKCLKDLCRYPDGNGFILKSALADKLSVGLNQITLGNGSNDILELIARAFGDERSEIIFSQYAFAVYPIATQAIGAKAVVVPAVAWGHDLKAMADAITPATRIIFIANPNNPTGTWIDSATLLAFMKRVPENVMVVLDEAYGEYIDLPDFPDGVSFLEQFPNIIVTRTFSKAFGLAALRVGYSVSHPQVADVLNRVRQPFNVNQPALVAATAALSDSAYLARSREVNSKGMLQLESGFKTLGLDFIPSVGNFVCVDVGRDARPVYDALLREGVIVRPVGNYGMPRHLRVSIGLESENARFIAALKAVLAIA
ncbi:MAG: histidinol-phosphate transaminase [Hahellaceae bacterium]|nr:histidinol-phosphate transaminase [Hahellaceae bacterium]